MGTWCSMQIKKPLDSKASAAIRGELLTREHALRSMQEGTDREVLVNKVFSAMTVSLTQVNQ